MLAELFELAAAFDRVGITPPREHPRVKQPGKASGPCLRIRLNATGAVSSIERVTDDEWSGLWTVMEGNQNSFPVVRLKEPLLPLLPPDLGSAESGQKRKPLSPQEQRARLLAAQDTPDVSPGRATQELIDRLISKKAPELDAVASTRPALRPVEELTRRFLAAAADLSAHQRQIRAALKAALQEDPSQALLDAASNLVFGVASKNGEGREAAIQLVYEADEYAGITYTAEVRSELISALLEGEVVNQASQPEGVRNRECAYSGSVGLLQSGPFPAVNLPVLGRAFPLVSMFSEAACNRRYGLTDSAIVPVAPAMALRLQDALKEIVSESRRDKNWRGIASGRFTIRSGRKSELKDLLIVYPAADPNLPETPVDLFASSIATPEITFTARARLICEALRGLERRHPGGRLHILAIRRVSEGQVQIAVSETPTVEEVIEGVNRWQAGARNLPPLGLPVPAGGGMVSEQPAAPFPEQVIQLLQEQWLRDGATRKKAGGGERHPHQPVPGPSLRDVLDLMLDPEGRGRDAAPTILRILIQRVGPLLTGLFGARERRTFLEEYPPDVRRVALRACSVLGICLYTCGSQKEEYMTQAAFDLGRLLALADILHRDYCVVVRDGMLPPSLVGNAVLGTAFQNPLGALSELAERMRLYIGWAETVKLPGKPDEAIAVRQARKTLRRLQPIAQRLHESSLPETCSDIEKAHLLLGYLASPKLEDDEQEDADGS